uniref:HRAS-like suppressor 3 n=1 Tax=Sinocyclocheilus grahami TaxID=75366 RepID=A0A672K7W1_SINGR
CCQGNTNSLAVEPKPGDLIEIPRPSYQHWAICSEEGNVIHIVPPSENADAGVSSVKSVLHNKAIVKKEKLLDVVGTDDYRIHNVLDKQHAPLPISHILQKAESLVGMVVPYNVLTDNCEHFVTGLRNGVQQSHKVYTLLGFISIVVFLLAVFYLAFTIA